MTKILVLTPETKDGQKIKKILTRAGWQVAWDKGESEVFSLIEETKPDLLIFDRRLVGNHGQDSCWQLRKEYPDLPIILLVFSIEEGGVEELCRAGADDFILKPIRPRALLSRIRMRLGDRDHPQPLLKVADLEINLETMKVKRGKRLIKLTPQEFNLLKFMVKNKGRILSREMILSRVWGYDAEVQSRAVDVYIGYLRKKIDQKAEKKLISTVRGFGYLIQDQPRP